MSLDLENLSEEDRQKVILLALAESAKKFDGQGFLDFYYLIWRRHAPPYAKQWVKSFMSGEWTILNCFRGSTKSTTMTITFSAFVLGHFPHNSILIVGANDSAGAKFSATIADIVEHYDGWKMAFPHVIPDKEKGWGAEGYFVKDTNYEKQYGYGAWLQKTQTDHLRDPSLIGLGYNSGQIPGMHPRWLLMDDLHDRKNSAYPKDREGVVDTVGANILPTITKAATGSDKPFIGVSCTFWDKQDAYHMLLATGLFKLQKTPAIKFTEDGDVLFDGKNAKLTWAEGFPLELVEKYRHTVSSKEFSRMYLCDIETDAFSMYNWMSFDEDSISPDWSTYLGIDPVDTYKGRQGVESGRSYFAMGRGKRTPMGGLVVEDGVLTQCAPSDMETYILREHHANSNLVMGVMETIGGGSASYDFMIANNAGMKVISYDQTWIYEKYRTNKEKRQYDILEPLFRNGVLQVSTRRSPYLDALRSYLEKYPNLPDSCAELDVADSVVMLVACVPDIGTQWRVAEGLLKLSERRTFKPSIWASIGDIRVN